MPLASAETLAAAGSFVFAGRTPLDQLRSLDCLAQAIYYEAASESEDGQRAVAQVVLNRVRHPAWPNSVCGVVYQGPMRAGGGCQFTFTCDGSLASARAGGPAGSAPAARRRSAGRPRLRARRPLDPLSHPAVSPSWAPRLARTALIGAHQFYALPGLAGARSAFSAAMRAPSRWPGRTRSCFPPRRRMQARFDAFAPPTPAQVRAAVAMPSDIPADPRWSATNLPESTIREEYRNTGQWRADAPAALSGGR